MSPLIYLLIFLLLSSCTSDTSLIDNPSSLIDDQNTCSLTLNLDFTTSETGWDTPSADTRASNWPATRIALRIFNADGTAALNQIDQRQGDAGFGTFTNIRLAPGSYKCVIVAHRASETNNASATISSPTVASIPEDVLWDTYTTVYDLTVAADTYTTQERTITIPLCVTRLQLTFLDAIPANAANIRITLNTAASKAAVAPIALNPTTGLATSDLSITRTMNVPDSHKGQTGKSYIITGLMSAYPKTCNVLVEALSSDGTPLFTRTLQNLTFNRGKIRKVSTNLFTGSVNATINFEDWSDDDSPIIIQ